MGAVETQTPSTSTSPINIPRVLLVGVSSNKRLLRPDRNPKNKKSPDKKAIKTKTAGSTVCTPAVKLLTKGRQVRGVACALIDYQQFYNDGETLRSQGHACALMAQEK